MDAKSTHDFDILVAGAGAAGLAAAIALAQRGWRTAICGPRDLKAGTRTVALFESQLRFFETLDVRKDIETAGQQLAAMRIVDATGSLFAPPPATFSASEIGLTAFGVNIESAALISILERRARTQDNLTVYDAFIDQYVFEQEHTTAALAPGQRLSAKLIIGADGAQSLARETAGIKIRTQDYPQDALTAILSHRADHHDVSTEFHTREGPCTLVPLPQADGAFRSSLVWLMSPASRRKLETCTDQQIESAIAKQTSYLLGSVKLLRPVNWFSMRAMQAQSLTAHRLALAGEAAHVFPPIGAQGLNLGLRDAQHLAQSIDPQISSDAGHERMLRAYQSARKGDIASRSLGVNTLGRALLNHSLLMDFARGAGLAAMQAIGPLRRFAMREGIAPGFAPGVKTGDAASRRM